MTKTHMTDLSWRVVCRLWLHVIGPTTNRSYEFLSWRVVCRLSVHNLPKSLMGLQSPQTRSDHRSIVLAIQEYDNIYIWIQIHLNPVLEWTCPIAWIEKFNPKHLQLQRWATVVCRLSVHNLPKSLMGLQSPQTRSDHRSIVLAIQEYDIIYIWIQIHLNPVLEWTCPIAWIEKFNPKHLQLQRWATVPLTLFSCFFILIYSREVLIICNPLHIPKMRCIVGLTKKWVEIAIKIKSKMKAPFRKHYSEPCFNYRYFGKSVAHVLRRFLNDSDPISFMHRSFSSQTLIRL